MDDIGKILPIEGYQVLLNGSLSFDYTISLTHLYQPLIGIEAVSLYMTLLNEMDFQESSKAQTHHTLMNYMDLPLDVIYRARRKLEGLGLLKTYKRESEEHTIYIYELRPPFAPGQFFADDMLTQLLYHHIGQTKFAMLKTHFQVPAFEKGTDMTAAFQDVFQTFQLHTDDVDTSDTTQTEETTVSPMDFSWLEQKLQAQMMPAERVLTPANKRVITQMMNLYGLFEHEIEKAVLWALTEEHALSVNEFKEACEDLFRTNHQQATIKLTEKQTNANEADNQETASDKQTTTKEEQLIKKLENISPRELLEDLSKGGQATVQDLKVIREVMTTQNLPAPVMNVLIHYVLLQSNMKLSKAYMETIAGHWSRAHLQTAREAMRFARRQQWSSGTHQTKQKNNRQPASREVVPDWFRERKKQQKNNHKEPSVNTDQEWEETEALLRKYSKKTNHRS